MHRSVDRTKEWLSSAKETDGKKFARNCAKIFIEESSIAATRKLKEFAVERGLVNWEVCAVADIVTAYVFVLKAEPAYDAHLLN